MSEFTPRLRGGGVLDSFDQPERANGHANGHTVSIKPQKPEAKREAASRFQALNAFVDFTMEGLSRAEIATWLVLFRDARGDTVQASVESIAKRAGTSKVHTHKAIKTLCEKGLLDCVKVGGINRGASVYRVHPTPKQAASH